MIQGTPERTKEQLKDLARWAYKASKDEVQKKQNFYNTSLAREGARRTLILEIMEDSEKCLAEVRESIEYFKVRLDILTIIKRKRK